MEIMGYQFVQSIGLFSLFIVVWGMVYGIVLPT